MTEEEAKNPFMVHCGACKYEWAAAFFPMEAKAFCEIALDNGKRCPRCGGKDVFCGLAKHDSSSSP